MKKVFLWLFPIVLIWAITITIFCFYRNPLPFPDRGHRCFAVPDEKAAKVVVGILDKIGGIPERFTFDAGSVSHTVLADNATVIIWDKNNQELLQNGLSVVSGDPLGSALEAVSALTQAGFSADIKDLLPEMGDKFSFIESNAFNGWVLIFRRHILVLGKPPNQRKLTK